MTSFLYSHIAGFEEILILLPLELPEAMCKINIRVRKLDLKVKWMYFLSKALNIPQWGHIDLTRLYY